MRLHISKRALAILDMSDLHKDCPTDLAQLRRKYNDDRFQQLNGLLGSATSNTWTYLLTVNGGSAAGLLAFIGSKPELAKLAWPYWTLILFVMGISFVGLAHAVITHKIQALIDNWIELTGKYWCSEIGWSDLLKADSDIVKKHKRVPWVLGWLSLLTFLVGVTWAAFGFRALASV